MVNLQKQKAALKRLRTTSSIATAWKQSVLDRPAIDIALKPLLATSPQASPLSKRQAEPRIEYALQPSIVPRTSKAPQPLRLPAQKSTCVIPQTQVTVIRVPRKRGRRHQKLQQQYGLVLSGDESSADSSKEDATVGPAATPESTHRPGLPINGVKALRETLERDVVFISLDTEFERHGLLTHVVEIGLSVLKTRKIRAVDPGTYGQNWFSLIEHHHVVIDSTRKPYQRMHSSLFGRSQFLSPAAARSALVEILKSLASKLPDKTTIVFVGHSVNNDFAALRECPALRVDIIQLCKLGIPGLHVEAIFDTHILGADARNEGISLPSLQLGRMVRMFGIDPKYLQADTLTNCHNAVNDAAYTLLGTLLMAINWNKLPRRADVEVVREEKEKGVLRKQKKAANVREKRKVKRDTVYTEEFEVRREPSWMQSIVRTLQRNLGFTLDEKPARERVEGGRK